MVGDYRIQDLLFLIVVQIIILDFVQVFFWKNFSKNLKT